MKINRRSIARCIGIGVLILGVVALFVGMRDEYTEVNVMTGAVRTSKRNFFVYQTPWVVRGSWLAESAARQGIVTEGGWRRISVVSKRLVFVSRGCSRAPVAYLLEGVSPEDMNLETGEEADGFVRRFVAADEGERERMLRSAAGS